MENTQIKPADLIIRKYVLTGISRIKVSKNSQLYDRIFQRYNTKEIEQIIEDYMTYKSNKVFPSVTDLKKFIAMQYNTDYKPETSSKAHKPTCVFSGGDEKDTFQKICQKAHAEGVCFIPYYHEQGVEFGNRNIIKNGKLYNRGYDWDDAIDNARKRNPSYFHQYPTANYLEQATIALICGEEW